MTILYPIAIASLAAVMTAAGAAMLMTRWGVFLLWGAARRFLTAATLSLAANFSNRRPRRRSRDRGGTTNLIGAPAQGTPPGGGGGGGIDTGPPGGVKP